VGRRGDAEFAALTRLVSTGREDARGGAGRVGPPHRWTAGPLDRFEADIASRDDAPVTLAVRVNGQDLAAEPALQAQVLPAWPELPAGTGWRSRWGWMS
jgi:hypothetical protein